MDIDDEIEQVKNRYLFLIRKSNILLMKKTQNILHWYVLVKAALDWAFVLRNSKI